ncbi:MULTISPECIES: bactofilin family protein [Lysobacteraceae]|jgi:cytoskeletal protein CcmA (bactofilin family)|uniref:Cytoskeletal protein CcmA (Bactofilin family) n=1 Tax=Agrilutibacter niabensis TaxID=380628 RepID=A0ABU1VN41_9GAMM|nr:polymer-forming cytoskeletal protein [Lysobacter niabensis]MDR7098891.1 cytoskeletal protein CcmA (bactofilin family) [Lysobacter niabensis]
MAIFNQQSASKRDIPAPVEASKPIETALKREPDPNEFSPVASVARAVPVERSEGKESLIASDLTIEGKIEGAGHIRIAGRFKGDVHVQGDLTIELGAKLNGGVRARKVTIAGELEGNIESAQRVELLASGVMVGDIKAETVTVAAGSRMKGQVEFGSSDKSSAKPEA